MVDAVLDAEIAREAHVAEPVVHEADVDVVVALELGDDLPEGIVLEAEAAVDPVDRAFGEGQSVRRMACVRVSKTSCCAGCRRTEACSRPEA